MKGNGTLLGIILGIFGLPWVSVQFSEQRSKK